MNGTPVLVINTDDGEEVLRLVTNKNHICEIIRLVRSGEIFVGYIVDDLIEGAARAGVKVSDKSAEALRAHLAQIEKEGQDE